MIFHGLQVITFNLISKKAHKRIVEILNLVLIWDLKILGTRFKITKESEFPIDRPILFVSNHQGMFDIPPIVWHVRKYSPKFVAKSELVRGVPSISYNLRHGGSVVIDRSKPEESLVKLKEFGKYIEENKYSAVIFAEGTRSKDGKLKPFKKRGIQSILDNISSAYIVPITISNSWRINEKGSFPLGIGNKIKVHFHKPLKSEDYSIDELMDVLPQLIASKLVQD